MSSDKFFEMVEKVFHDWHYDHPRILYALIRSLKPEVVVETGTYRGYAACYMAQAIKENGRGHLFCIDDFRAGKKDVINKFDRTHWQSNLHKCGVLDHVTLIESASEEAKWPDKIDFAYVDGWHSYKMCAFDFYQCAIRGAECICIDDTDLTVGTRLFVQRLTTNYEMCAGEWNVCEVHRDCGLTICTRKVKKRPVTFCQESSTNDGLYIDKLTIEQQRELLNSLTAETGVNYNDLIL